MISYVTKRMR